MSESAKAWDVSQERLLGLWALPCVVALSGIAAALVSKGLFKLLTDEDRVAEDLQVVFYGFALILSFLVARQLWQPGRLRMALLYVVVAGGLFFLIGEEVSWGQRVFGWQTPVWWAASNKQQETNLHNLYGVGTAFKWIELLAGAYGTLLPLVVWRSTWLARHSEALALMIPHYSLIPYFLPLLIWRLFRSLYEVPSRYSFAAERYNEVMELILALGIFLFMLFQWRTRRRKEEVGSLGEDM